MQTTKATLRIKLTTTEQYVTLMSGVVRLTGQSLTDMEVRVLATFVDLHLEMEKQSIKVNPFSPEMKKVAAKRLGKKDFNTLNNFLKSLCDKKVLTRTEDGYTIRKFFIPVGNSVQIYHK